MGHCLQVKTKFFFFLHRLCLISFSSTPLSMLLPLIRRLYSPNELPFCISFSSANLIWSDPIRLDWIHPWSSWFIHILYQMICYPTRCSLSLCIWSKHVYNHHHGRINQYVDCRSLCWENNNNKYIYILVYSTMRSTRLWDSFHRSNGENGNEWNARDQMWLLCAVSRDIKGVCVISNRRANWTDGTRYPMVDAAAADDYSKWHGSTKRLTKFAPFLPPSGSYSLSFGP